MPDKPVKLKLVPPPTHLGDLSHVPAKERAGLIYQDGLRRLAEELIIAEANALRMVFWVAGLGSGGILVAFGVDRIPWGLRSSWFGMLADILIFIGLLAAFLCACATLVFGVKWLMAMIRRRKVIKTLSSPTGR